MTAREYLSQARMIDSRINSKLVELQRTRELATRATGTVSDMPRNPTPDLQQMESRVVKIVDLEKEINAEIDELVDLKRDIRELIAQIRKPEYRTVLELRYLGMIFPRKCSAAPEPFTVSTTALSGWRTGSCKLENKNKIIFRLRTLLLFGSISLWYDVCCQNQVDSSAQKGAGSFRIPKRSVRKCP